MRYLLLVALVFSLTSFSVTSTRKVNIDFQFKRSAKGVYAHFLMIPNDGKEFEAKCKLLGPKGEVIFDQKFDKSMRTEFTFNGNSTYGKEGEYTFIIKPKGRDAVAVKFPAKKRKYKFNDSIPLD